MITQVLDGWTGGIEKHQIPRMDQHSGLPLMKDGKPDTQNMYVLVLVEKTTGNQIRFQFDENAKDQLVRSLTSGVILANGIPSM